MPKVVRVGEHWAVIKTKTDSPNSDRWTALWAVYASKEEAEKAPPGKTARSLVSGAVAVFDTEEKARARAEFDAERSAAVMSGTYRD